MKKTLTFKQHLDLLSLNCDLEQLQKEAQKIADNLNKANEKSEQITQLINTLEDLANFDLIDSINNVNE